MTEIWKDIPGHEGSYQVSDAGNIRSVDRDIIQLNRFGEKITRHLKGQIFRPRRCQSGHVTVVLGRARGSQHIHKVVMLAFVGEKAPGLEIRHLNGNPADNRLENLAYGSRSENLIDKAYHGQRKLTIADVIEIRTCTTGPIALAKKFGVSRNHITNIRNRKKGCYDHVA